MKGKLSSLVLVLLLCIVGAAAVVLVLLNEREPPRVEVTGDLSFLGISQEIPVTVRDARSGVRAVTVFLEQHGRRVELLNKSWARRGYFSHGGDNEVRLLVRVDTPQLKMRDGRADLVIQATDFSFWNFMAGNTATFTRPVILDTAKPKLRILDSPRYISAGGTSIIRYRVNEPVVGHGAVINGHFYPGVPVSDKDDTTLAAMLALPYDTTEIKEMYLTAADRAGNTVTVPFGMVLRKLRPNHDRITVSDRFLERKLPEFTDSVGALPGDSLSEQYLYVNRQIRRADNEKIRSICSRVTPVRHWNGRFKRLPRASRRSGFADYRTYYYHGRKIDDQVHLGIDLASVRNAEVPAAETGTVVFADALGIYGNMVIIDHGWGVFSLYSHLSRIDVAENDTVSRGDIIGRTGATGMAGGDHLHYGMLVNGVFVNPLEWWDAQWLKVNLLSYL